MAPSAKSIPRSEGAARIEKISAGGGGGGPAHLF